MKVHWTDNATEHLTHLRDYIAQGSPLYAEKIVDRLTRRSEQIALFPLSGRKVPEFDLRNLREVIEGPYRILYHIRPDQIDIIAVIHGAQSLTPTE